MNTQAATPIEQETLGPADVAGMETAATDAFTPDPWLDPVADYLKGGAQFPARIIAQVFQNPSPDAGAIEAMEKRLALDPRFLRFDSGTWDLLGLPMATGVPRVVAAPFDEPAEATAPVVAPVEGVGSETVASDRASPAVLIASTLMEAGADTIRQLREQLAAAKDELRAYKDRAAEERDLTDAIRKAGSEVEAAKEVLAGKKATLATAHEELFLFASGDTQTSHPDLSGDDDSEEVDLFAKKAPAFKAGDRITHSVFGLGTVIDVQPGAHGAEALIRFDTQGDKQLTLAFAEGKLAHVTEPEAPKATPPAPEDSPAAVAKPVAREHVVPADQEIPADVHGLTVEKLSAALCRELQPGKPRQVGPSVVSIKGCDWLIRDHSADQTRWFAQRVLSKDEYQQLHEKQFGMAVHGFDQNEEARHHRTQGGEDCGRMVKIGRKLGVMGPESEGLVLLLPAAEGNVIEGSDAFDHKAAAANDGTLRDEQDSFVAGDTPGGVVNSDPND